jgi:light-harvesting complex 1 beta chain
MAQQESNLRAGFQRSEMTGFRFIFATGFITLLVFALAGWLLMLPLRSWLPGAEGGESLIDQVKSAVYSLMSHVP